jgi:hypothetical protein
MKALKLDAKRRLSQPGRAANVVSTYCARSGAGFGGGQTGQGFCGSCAQPAISTITSQANRDMWIVYLEMFIALAIAFLIVWFTWPRKPK